MSVFSIQSNDFSKVEIYHPATRGAIGTFHIAGPDHEATRAWKRDIADRRARRGYKENIEAELVESLCRRTIGWENKDNEPFDKGLLPELYKQDWLMSQVLNAIGEEGFFYRE